MSLAQRSITSVGWNAIASLAATVILFIRSVLLARWLPVEVFGVYAFATTIVLLTSVLPRFGMDSAFLHRAPESLNEERIAATHFSLKLLFTLSWAVILTICTLAWTEGATRTALLLITSTAAVVQLVETPRLILTRRVVHRRLALLSFGVTCLTSAIALGLAWQGATLWALLATDLVTMVLTVVLLYVWRPVWRPRLGWSPEIVRYLLRFGSRSVLATIILQALDRLDDLWVGLYLGSTSMGFYSRAYRFATYPRSILAGPINQVVGGTYTELKGDRHKLSSAFFSVNALLVRSGFFLAGLLFLIAPEFIQVALGAKWLPMLDAFRLMLIFTLLDPVKASVSNVFIAVGRPEQIVRARFVQLAVLLVGLFVLGPKWNISGVALAVDAMLVVGMVILFYQARAHVDFSILRLFAAPGLSLVLAMLTAYAVVAISDFSDSAWLTGIIKAGSYSAIYLVAMLLLEREQIPLLLSLSSQLRLEARSALHSWRRVDNKTRQAETLLDPSVEASRAHARKRQDSV